MNRIAQIKSVLNKRGITKNVSETDVINAIKSLPCCPIPGIPAYADSSAPPVLSGMNTAYNFPEIQSILRWYGDRYSPLRIGALVPQQ